MESEMDDGLDPNMRKLNLIQEHLHERIDFVDKNMLMMLPPEDSEPILNENGEPISNLQDLINY